MVFRWSIPAGGFTLEHDLKIYPEHYARVANGSKNFEIRYNDRGFQQGDTVILREWDPTSINDTTMAPRGYTDAKPLKFKIGYVHVLDKERVVFSLLTIPANKKGNVIKLV